MFIKYKSYFKKKFFDNFFFKMIIFFCQKNDEEQILILEKVSIFGEIRNVVKWILGEGESRLWGMEFRKMILVLEYNFRGKEGYFFGLGLFRGGRVLLCGFQVFSLRL